MRIQKEDTREQNISRKHKDFNKLVKYILSKVSKVQLFWEDHKNVHHPPYGFDVYLVNVKTVRRVAHIFVAFSEKLNFSMKQE